MIQAKVANNIEYSLDFNDDFTSFGFPDEMPLNVEAKLVYSSQQTIFEKIIKCTVKAHELKYTYNPTTLVDPTDPNSSINSIFINSEFTPYVTAVGLYNEANELLAIAKFELPINIPQHTEITFIIRIDF